MVEGVWEEFEDFFGFGFELKSNSGVVNWKGSARESAAAAANGSESEENSESKDIFDEGNRNQMNNWLDKENFFHWNEQ